jgi:hypothetical protein
MTNTRRKFLLNIGLATAGLSASGKLKAAAGIDRAAGQAVQADALWEAGAADLTAIGENEFYSVPQGARPWVYYWWQKGNVTKQLISRDLNEMKKKGIGGLLLLDSRNYHDGFEDGIIPVPLPVKMEFMSVEWRELVLFMLQEAARLGLKVSINMANTGGALRGPWDMKEQAPKDLIWTATTVAGGKKISLPLQAPADKKYFQDVTIVAARITGGGKEDSDGLNGSWNEVVAPTANAPVVEAVIDVKDKLKGNVLEWDVPPGKWRIIRFGYHVIGDPGSVDILDANAVTAYFNLMGAVLVKDAGELVGTTLTHFYNVSWEGGRPNWTVGFEKQFQQYRGYELQAYLPILAGMKLKDPLVHNRFLYDYFKTISDCFRVNCYVQIGKLCHQLGMQWHSENGGPWERDAAMFRDADMFSFWGENDMPQGEFWCGDMNDLTQKSNVRSLSMAAHTYGRPLVAVESFTDMDYHYSKYPAFLKPFADINFVDGGNFFVLHTFTASPLHLGKPGYEYFAGTHFNTNNTWWQQSGNFFDYLGRCQYLLRKGHFVADVCCYVSDANYVRWGRAKKWNEKSALMLDAGYAYDMVNTGILSQQLTVKDGMLVLPGGMRYSLLVIDPDITTMPLEALKKIAALVKAGATVVLGNTRPVSTGDLRNYPQCDTELVQLAEQLWGKGQGDVFRGVTMKEVLKRKQLLPDVEGPFEYIHRRSDKEEIYFITGKGTAACIFRVKDLAPEIWDPVSGRIKEAISYGPTADGRTRVVIDLPDNGAVFVVFRRKADNQHFVAVNGPAMPEVMGKDSGSLRVRFWKKGAYTFASAGGRTEKVVAAGQASKAVAGPWNVQFAPEEGGAAFTAVLNELSLWNEHADDRIKYFAGTAVYQATVVLEEAMLNSPARLELGQVSNIARVWVNGTDLGIVWTAPWSVELGEILKKGTNDIKIAVTNCWANRLIGEARLPANERTITTNIRLVADRTKYKKRCEAYSAQDPLMPSGLLGPVTIEFGEVKEVAI